MEKLPNLAISPQSPSPYSLLDRSISIEPRCSARRPSAADGRRSAAAEEEEGQGETQSEPAEQAQQEVEGRARRP